MTPVAAEAAVGKRAIRCINPVTDPAWGILLRQPAAGLFHSPPWLRAVADAYGFIIRAYLVDDAPGKAAGGVAFCEIDDFAGHRLVAMPFSDTCDPLFTSFDAWRALYRQLQSHRVPVNLRCLIEHRVLGEESLSIVKRARWHRLSVVPPPEDLWSGLAAAGRRAIRKAERAGVEIRPLTGEEGRDGFYRLHVALRKRKYRLLAQPPAFFEAIARRFNEVGGWHPLGAFLGGRLIAATVYLRWGDTLYYKFNASALDALGARPNNLLVWAGIRLARSMGCRSLDLGPSDDNQPGLIRFKRGFGAEEQELRFLRWTPPGWRDDREAEARRILGEMTSLVTAPDVPDEITARGGKIFYRYFA
jgi:CelD/BcsL family acetyltransferase involved in cellulose biosynthesis